MDPLGTRRHPQDPLPVRKPLLRLPALQPPTHTVSHPYLRPNSVSPASLPCSLELAPPRLDPPRLECCALVQSQYTGSFSLITTRLSVESHSVDSVEAEGEDTVAVFCTSVYHSEASSSLVSCRGRPTWRRGQQSEEQGTGPHGPHVCLSAQHLVVCHRCPSPKYNSTPSSPPLRRLSPAYLTPHTSNTRLQQHSHLHLHCSSAPPQAMLRRGCVMPWHFTEPSVSHTTSHTLPHTSSFCDCTQTSPSLSALPLHVPPMCAPCVLHMCAPCGIHA